MDLIGSDEDQETFRGTIRAFFREKSPEAEVRRLMATEAGYDSAVWQQMARQGLQGLAIAEEYGGQGFTIIESAIVMEEGGRSLLCAPYFATTALAVPALVQSADTPACARYLPGIAAGETIATLAVTERSGRWDAGSIETIARQSGEGYVLTGDKTYVIDGHIAGLILAVAEAPRGISLFAVDANAPGMAFRRLETMDQTRKLASLAFRETPAVLIGEEGAAWPVIERTLQMATTALAAEQAGGAQAVLDMCVAYAKSRYQFGRPIGSFQAIKHLCADLLVSVESARSAAYYAAWAAAEDLASLPIASSLAKAVCSDAFVRASSMNIQIHGGIGFAWEHPAHLYLKRAKSTQLYLGDSGYHREQVARLLHL